MPVKIPSRWWSWWWWWYLWVGVEFGLCVVLVVVVVVEQGKHQTQGTQHALHIIRQQQFSSLLSE